MLYPLMYSHADDGSPSPALLKSVDRRANALGVSRNRLIVRALERAVTERAGSSPEFLEGLREVDDDTVEAVDDLVPSSVPCRNRQRGRTSPLRGVALSGLIKEGCSCAPHWWRQSKTVPSVSRI
jgi:hypothetical protein